MLSQHGRQRRRQRHAEHGLVDHGGGKAAAVKFGVVAAGTGYTNGGSLEQKGHTGLSLGVCFARKAENVGDVEEPGHEGQDQSAKSTGQCRDKSHPFGNCAFKWGRRVWWSPRSHPVRPAIVPDTVVPDVVAVSIVIFFHNVPRKGPGVW